MTMRDKLKALAVIALLVAGLSACSQEPETPETPDACITALNTAEELVTGPLTEQTIESAGIAALVPEAFEAGYTEDVAKAQSISSDLEEIASRTETRTKEIEALVKEYNTAAESCRGETTKERDV